MNDMAFSPELFTSVSAIFLLHCIGMHMSVYVPQKLSQVGPINRSNISAIYIGLLMAWREGKKENNRKQLNRKCVLQNLHLII